ncbi:hypothetical protein S7711_05083 [Stachybotrys chartarum IBT 7711]|uniref:HSF-type DNA-binding domain-containing protein n=1 Tax=Stachybotrys chartarum (strain CBS 109288 / IBT 7711) TaxID=1280523 RepID=A0A084ANT4_STACB|nr:hypothetical protein S7711_05083 [Stachybotrys chartarum IBT 7711]KFA47425.1 hypothetical protein S40293_05360 [Stachybotrys chartarum IBT 40293]
MSNTIPGSGSRKRAAPGASPVVPISQPMQQPYATGNPSADQLMRWNGTADATGYADGNAHPSNTMGLMQGQPQYPQSTLTPSTALARRQANHALVQTNSRPNYDPSADPWQGFGEDGSLMPPNPGENISDQDNIELLEEMAQKAKRDAQGKRKGIPPFVQKLSSFLEEGKNEDLIRWSSKGDSFIVLDEDEFAKTLIPELFKHNKYASFVRQLNMYGFHKRVGLSDNSMRASERKNKSPSEYSNPFFRRGHPNLLWLINKPSSGNKSKKGSKSADGDVDSEEEVGVEEPLNTTTTAANVPTGRSLPPAESQPLQKKEMAVIREDIKTLRDQQKYILGAITQLQRNNNNLYNQAVMFQNQHERHQNSINAILTFLANVFRKTLEDQGNGQSVSDIISSMISNQGQQQPSQQGSVVDLGDFFQSSLDPTSSPLSGPHKRPRGLLPPIPTHDPSIPATRQQSVSSGGYHPRRSQSHQTGHITELFEPSPADTPPTLRQELESNPHERMMKIITDHNATNTSGLDLPEAAELVANTPNTLSHDQRSNLVNFMAGQPGSNASTPGVTSPGVAPHTTMPSVPTRSGTTPPIPDVTAAPSLSPILRSPQVPPPSLTQINANQIDLEELQRLQSEQDAKISELGDILGPLSPSGRIPGLETADNYFGDGSIGDLDQFFNSDAFLQDGNFAQDGADFNLDLGPMVNNDNLNIPGANGGSLHNTPSPAGTEEIQRHGFMTNGSDDRESKRRRRD